MRFIVLALALSLVLVPTLCVRTQKGQKHMDQQDLNRQIRTLQQTRIGKMFMELAELAVMSGGLVGDVTDNVEVFGEQIAENLQLDAENFQAIAGEHASKQIALQAQINSAEVDINREEKLQTQEIEPRIEELEETIMSLKTKLSNNKQATETEEASREAQHERFIETTNDLTESVRDVDQTLEFIEEVAQELAHGSFAQVSVDHKKKIQASLKKVKAHTEKYGHQFSSFAGALTQLSQDFQDAQVIKQINEFLNNLRASIQESLQKAYDQEHQESQNSEQRLNQLKEEEELFSSQYSEAVQEREEKGIRLVEIQNYLEQRKIDLRDYETRLTLENTNYSSNQKIFDDAQTRINEQLGVTEKVLDMLEAPEYSEFLANKIG